MKSAKVSREIPGYTVYYRSVSKDIVFMMSNSSPGYVVWSVYAFNLLLCTDTPPHEYH